MATAVDFGLIVELPENCNSGVCITAGLAYEILGRTVT